MYLHENPSVTLNYNIEKQVSVTGKMHYLSYKRINYQESFIRLYDLYEENALELSLKVANVT